MLNAVKEVEEFMMGLSFEDFCEDSSSEGAFVFCGFFTNEFTRVPFRRKKTHSFTI